MLSAIEALRRDTQYYDIQHDVTLSIKTLHSNRCYVECRYAECRNAECRGAQAAVPIFYFSLFNVIR